MTPQNDDDPEEDEQFIFEKQNANLQTNARIVSDEVSYLQKWGDLRQKAKP